MDNKSSRLNYLTGIDGLRAISVLAVMIYHIDLVSFLPGGFTGVDVFFVISGYVISKSLAKKASLRFPEYLSEFYKKRILRIFPALIVCLTATILASTLFIPAAWLSSTNSETGLAAFFGYSNFALIWHTDGYFSPRVDFNPFLHTWSLAVEEQFYLFFPLLFYIWLKFSNKKSVWGYLSRGLLPGLAGFSLVYAYFQTFSHHDEAFYLLPSRFWELAAGALLFKLHSFNLCISNSRWTSNMFLVPGLVLLGIGFAYADQNSFPYPWAMVPVVGAMLSISGVTHVSNNLSVIHKVLQSSVATYIGKISYSLYLWHWPVAVLLRWTVGFDRPGYIAIYFVVVFLLAAASYHLIESPIRTNTFLLKQKSWKLILGGLAIIYASHSAAIHIDQSQSTLSLSVTKDRYVWYSYAWTPKEPAESIYADLAGRRLFVVGDSHTAAYNTMLRKVSFQLGIELYTYEHGGCPIANLLKPMSQEDDCQAFYDYTFAEVERLARPDDIVFFASLRIPTLSDQFEPYDEATVMADIEARMTSERLQRALEETSQLIEMYNAQGIHVLIDAPKPVVKVPPYRCSDWFNDMNPICTPGFSVDREFLLELRQPVMDSLSVLENKHPDLSVWDPFFVLCETEICSAYDGDKPLFFDGDHITAHANRVLVPSFKSKLVEIWSQ